MSQNDCSPDCRAHVADAVDRALDAGVDPQPAAVDAVEASPDDWFVGRFLAAAHESATGVHDPDAYRPAAAAVALLRSYSRVRTASLPRHTTGETASPARDTTDGTVRLLAGDYAYAASFSALADSPGGPLAPCFDALTAASGTVVAALHGVARRSPVDAAAFGSFVDDTAGVLGTTAATVGATLADSDDRTRTHLEAFGRGVAAGRELGLALDDRGPSARLLSPDADRQWLVQRAHRRVADAALALDALEQRVDPSPLGRLVDETTASLPESP